MRLSVRVIDVVLELIYFLSIALGSELLLLFVNVVDLILLSLDHDLCFLKLVFSIGSLFLQVSDETFVPSSLLLEASDRGLVTRFDLLNIGSKARNLVP